MSAAIPSALRALVIERARGRCEYCLKPQVGFFAHEIDHVIALKHGGATSAENLAFACLACNRHKGTDVASVSPESGAIVPLFNPRTQEWRAHFRMEEGTIVPLTDAGAVTVHLLRLNERERVAERRALGVQLRLP